MENLGDLRKKIDSIDRELLKNLAKRFSVARKIGEYKKKNNLNAYDPKREKEVFHSRRKWAEVAGLDSDLVENIFKLIIKKVKKNHKEISNGKQ